MTRALRYRAPDPEDTNTVRIAARLRERLKLRRADGGPEPLFVPLPLYNRDPSARREYPGQIAGPSTARAEDMNDLQLRALDALGRLDADVELLTGRARIEIASEISRLRRVHDAFVWSTSIEPSVPGEPDPNPDDLWDVLRRETRARFHEAVGRLSASLGRFWDGPPEFESPYDGYPPRRVAVALFEEQERTRMLSSYDYVQSYIATVDDEVYARRLLYLRVWLPFCRWPLVTPSAANPDAVEASAVQLYAQATGDYAPLYSLAPPKPGQPFYEWLYGGEGDEAMRRSSAVSGGLGLPPRTTSTSRPGRDKDNYLEP